MKASSIFRLDTSRPCARRLWMFSLYITHWKRRFHEQSVVACAPRTPCLTGSPVRFIVHRTRSQSIPSPALGCLTWPGKYLLIKDQRKTPCAAWCSSLVSGGYLFSRAVTSQVSSAYKGLTSVFGMRTGGSP